MHAFLIHFNHETKSSNVQRISKDTLQENLTTHCTAIMASTDAEIYDPNSSDTLSDALGTETLDARSMAPNDHYEAPDT